MGQFFEELKRRNVLRVAIAYLAVSWLLIQIVETLFPIFGLSDASVRLVVILLTIGFPLTLIFSWVYELTPEGLKLERDVDRARSIVQHTGKKLDRAIIVVLTLALGYFAVDKFVLEPARDAEREKTVAQRARSEAFVESFGDKSIAVLPFVNMSDDASNEYFSDGISEELLNLLSQIPQLRVISRSSSFSFKGKDVAIPTIAEQLHVAYVLEGSVRKVGNRVRITAQLIEARSDSHLWSETYDRTLGDIFAIQDEIAAKVVNQLKVKLVGTTLTIVKTDPEAYGLYLHARYLSRQGSAEALEQAISLNEQALAIDPNYAAAWASLAGNFSEQAARGFRPWDERFSLARKAARKALAIDSDNAWAHVVYHSIAEDVDRDLAAAGRHLERALALEPANAGIIVSAAVFLNNLGRLEQSIVLKEHLVSVDPLSPINHFNLGYGYLSAGRWDDAITALGTALRFSPSFSAAHYLIGTALLMNSQAEAALEEMQLEPLEPLKMIGLVLAHHALGQVDKSNVVLEEVVQKYPKWAYNFAYMHAFRNEDDRAFGVLEKAVEYDDPGLAEIVGEVMFANIRDDPRWLPFLEAIGKSPDKLDAVQFKVTLPK